MPTPDYPDLMPDFPDDDESESFSPVQILRAQATFLSNKTGRQVLANIEPARSGSSRIAYNLFLEAPIVGYRYKVIRIEFGLESWPVSVSTPLNPVPEQCQDEEHYRRALQRILASDGFRVAVNNIRKLVREEIQLSPVEKEILEVFREFNIGANETLPMNSLTYKIQEFAQPAKSEADEALDQLRERGLITETTDGDAYILTSRGADIIYNYLSPRS